MVNPLKTTRDAVAAGCWTMAWRLKPVTTRHWAFGYWKNRPCRNTPLFLDGSIEVQDEGSQLLAYLVAPKRGEMVADFCAGAGGKT